MVHGFAAYDTDKSKAKPAGDEPLEAEKKVQRNVDVDDLVDDLESIP